MKEAFGRRSGNARDAAYRELLEETGISKDDVVLHHLMEKEQPSRQASRLETERLLFFCNPTFF